MLSKSKWYVIASVCLVLLFSAAISVTAQEGLLTADYDLAALGNETVPGTAETELAPGLPGMMEYDPATNSLYWNGDFVTLVGGGHNGFNLSAVQSSLGMALYGVSNRSSSNNSVADDFRVPRGSAWRLDEGKFFGYQVNSGLASTFNAVYWRIWNGRPGDLGSAVIYGNLDTNRLLFSSFYQTYRAMDTNPFDNSRPIMEIRADIGSITLPEGHYWLEWSVEGSINDHTWANPITIVGQTTTGNARIFYGSTSTWNDVTDPGTGTNQGMPFELIGEEMNLVTAIPSGTWYYHSRTAEWQRLTTSVARAISYVDINGDGNNNLVAGLHSGTWYIDHRGNWQQLTRSTATALAGNRDGWLAISIPSGTWIYDAYSDIWHQLSSVPAHALTWADTTYDNFAETLYASYSSGLWAVKNVMPPSSSTTWERVTTSTVGAMDGLYGGYIVASMPSGLWLYDAWSDDWIRHYTTSTARDITFADMNGDGDPDLVVGLHSGTWYMPYVHIFGPEPRTWHQLTSSTARAVQQGGGRPYY